jgi:hypothetical protein
MFLLKSSKIGMSEEKGEEIREKKVVKRGNEWCVVHCSETKKDQIIKCFSTKTEAVQMHKAIERSQALRKKELDYDATVLSNEELYGDAITFIGIYHDLLYDVSSVYSRDEIMDCAACALSEIAIRKNEGFCDYQFDPQSYPENSISRGFWNGVKQNLSNGEIAQLMMNEEAYTQLEKEAYNRKGLVLEKSTELCDEEYKALLKTGEFENKPLPPKYYKSPSKGVYVAQVHVIGITQEEHDDYEAGKIPLWKSFVGHSIHVDWRGSFEGREKMLQIVIVESSIDAYLRVLRGEKDKKINNVAKGLMLVEDEKIDFSAYVKAKKEMILNPTNAKKIAKFVIENKSFFIEPNNPGSTKDAYGYLGCIGYGDVKTGILREDYFELFCVSSSGLPTKNQAIFNGRWIWKAFKKPRYLWWCWEAATNPNSGNSWLGCDQGNYILESAEDITRFGKEEYPEYKLRLEACNEESS